MDKKSAFLAYLEGYLSLLVNGVLFGLKYWVGTVSGSVAVIADAWHTLSDSFTSLVVIMGTHASTRPADRDHPFGHGRAELIASIVIGVLLGLVGFNFVVEAINRLTHHQTATYGTWTLVVIGLSILLKEGMAQFSFWAGKKARSHALKADAWHHRSDAVTSAVILVGILTGKQLWWMDGVLGLMVAALLLYTTYDILKGAINPLLGEAADPGVVDNIKKISHRVAPDCCHIHHIHLHRYGRHTELTFHIHLDGTMSLKQAHNIATAIENAIRKELSIETTIHVEPNHLQ